MSGRVRDVDAAPGVTGSRTIAEALVRARRHLSAAGVDDPGGEARKFVAAASGFDLPRLLSDGDHLLESAAVDRLEGWLARREAGEPPGRILGRRGFWTLDLLLSSETLEPRPDTETLVAAVLKDIDRERSRAEPLTIADLGTGSGAILLALLAECPNAIGIGTDISEAALDTARANAERHGLEGRAHFVCGDFAAALQTAPDVLVSNPPYVLSGEMVGLPYDVSTFDPARALDGGVDGLACYRTILDQAADLKRAAPASLYLELSPQLADDLASLAQAAGWTVAAWHRDLTGRVRVLHVRLPK